MMVKNPTKKAPLSPETCNPENKPLSLIVVKQGAFLGVGECE